MTTPAYDTIDNLIARQRHGYSLEQPFYTDEAIFQRDMQRVVHKQWLLFDHVSRIPNPGDYFVATIAGDEVIVCRDREGGVRAFFNTCRHRGSKVCLNKEGNTRAFVCPYHAWIFNLDGSLRIARLMDDDFDKSAHGLHPCHVHVYEGLIFLCLSEDTPPDFETEFSRMQPCMDMHDLSRAKVAHRHVWTLACNWKLVLENFFECYHCLPSHPELSSMHSKAKYLAYGAGPTSAMPEAVTAFQPEFEEWLARCEALGHPTENWGDDDGTLSLQSAGRLPINIEVGALSETKDGKLASTLMGEFKESDGGTTAVSFNPFSTLLMPNDYAMIFRFTPISAQVTDVEVVWMVDQDAEEGKDYDKDKLIWLWYETTVQDGDITENNHAGVLSSRYQPGPYSKQEEAIKTLGKWYLRLASTSDV